MIYYPFYYFNWWEYHEWLRWKFIFPEFMDAIVADTDGYDWENKGEGSRAIEDALKELSLYCANYIRHDYEEAENIAEQIERVSNNYWPHGSNGRCHIYDILNTCNRISEQYRPKNDYPDTYRY